MILAIHERARVVAITLYHTGKQPNPSKKVWEKSMKPGNAPAEIPKENPWSLLKRDSCASLLAVLKGR